MGSTRSFKATGRALCVPDWVDYLSHRAAFRFPSPPGSPTPRIMFYTYILANRPKGTLYIGHTDELQARVAQHVAGEVKGLTAKHKACVQLMWFEIHETRASAFDRQERMKADNRSRNTKRLRLLNPKWADLSLDLNAASLNEPQRVFPSDTALDDMSV